MKKSSYIPYPAGHPSKDTTSSPKKFPAEFLRGVFREIDLGTLTLRLRWDFLTRGRARGPTAGDSLPESLFGEFGLEGIGMSKGNRQYIFQKSLSKNLAGAYWETFVNDEQIRLINIYEQRMTFLPSKWAIGWEWFAPASDACFAFSLFSCVIIDCQRGFFLGDVMNSAGFSGDVG